MILKRRPDCAFCHQSLKATEELQRLQTENARMREALDLISKIQVLSDMRIITQLAREALAEVTEEK